MCVRGSIFGLMVLFAMISFPVLGQANEPLKACDRPLIIRASESYSPFSIKDANGMASGLDNAFIAKVMQTVGCKYQFVFLPWKRSLYQLKHGEIDILPSASYTEERSKYGLFSEPYRNDITGFVVLRGDSTRLKISDLDDIVKYDLKIGHVRGAYRGKAFEAFMATPEGARHVIDVAVAPHGINLLVNHRVDALIGIPPGTMAQAEKLGVADKVEPHPFILGKEPVHLMYSRNRVAPALVQLIDAAIIGELKSADYQGLFGYQAISANEYKPVLSQ